MSVETGTGHVYVGEVTKWAYLALGAQIGPLTNNGGRLSMNDERRVVEVYDLGVCGDRFSGTFEIETSDGSTFEVVVTRKDI